MEHLTSPKITLGVHCLILRHKGMYVMSVPYPDESNFYDIVLSRVTGAVRRSQVSSDASGTLDVCRSVVAAGTEDIVASGLRSARPFRRPARIQAKPRIAVIIWARPGNF